MTRLDKTVFKMHIKKIDAQINKAFFFLILIFN